MKPKEAASKTTSNVSAIGVLLNKVQQLVDNADGRHDAGDIVLNLQEVILASILISEEDALTGLLKSAIESVLQVFESANVDVDDVDVHQDRVNEDAHPDAVIVDTHAGIVNIDVCQDTTNDVDAHLDSTNDIDT